MNSRTVDPKRLEQSFLAFLHERSVDPVQAPEAAARAMLAFYRDVRAENCDFDHDADMLLFQWGTYDWGDGAHFEVDLTRQVILPDEDDDDAIWQLHLTYRCPPTPDLAAHASGNRWCHDLAELEDFVHSITASDPFACLATPSGDATVVVKFENAG